MTTVKMVKLGTLIKPAKLQKCGNDDYPVLSMTMHNGLVFQSDKFKKSVASQDKSTYKVVHRNQLVIGFPIDEGVLATQRITDVGFVSPAYGIWDVDQTKIIPEFLEYALRCNRAIDYYKAKLRGSTARRRSLPTPTLLELDVPLPDIEQQRLALATIHHAKNALDSRQAQLTKLDELVKARFVEMFGDPYTNSKDYPLKKGESFFKLSNGKAVPESKRLNGGIPAYGGNGISWYTDESLFDADTIVVGRVGFQSGNVHLVKGPLWVTDNAMYMSSCDFSQYNLTFLIELMAHVDFTKFQDAGDLKKITQKPFMQFEYLCPPLSLQNQFAAFVAEVDKSKVEVQKALDQTQLLFDSLMQQYFG